jgi:sulfur-oxidizing protein SoxZ
MAAPRISVPDEATKGEVIEIRTLISHRMENGHNIDVNGRFIPRHIINKFVVTYNGKQIFQANLYPAQAANPYFIVYATARESGELEFTWYDDDGTIYRGTRPITVV